MTRTLVLMRHGKSDWGVSASDRERPLMERGRRQAVEAGEWLAAHLPDIDQAFVSTARRAYEAWEQASSRLVVPPPMRLKESAYTFDGHDLIHLVRRIEVERTVVLVGHNPALEEAVASLTGESVTMRTSALVVVELSSWGSAGDGSALLVAQGRPPLS